MPAGTPVCAYHSPYDRDVNVREACETEWITPGSEAEFAARAANDMLPREFGRTVITFIVEWRYAPWSNKWNPEGPYNTEDEALRDLNRLRESDAENGRETATEYRIIARTDTIVHAVNTR